MRSGREIDLRVWLTSPSKCVGSRVSTITHPEITIRAEDYGGEPIHLPRASAATTKAADELPVFGKAFDRVVAIVHDCHRVAVPSKTQWVIETDNGITGFDCADAVPLDSRVVSLE
jgi:hypothetical protein